MTELPPLPPSTASRAEKLKIYAKRNAVKSKQKKVSKQEEFLERFFFAAIKAGCPKEQSYNFAKAGLYPQPRQLEFAAACRSCDSPDGALKVGYGGARGGGKSWIMLAQVSADDCQRFNNLTVLYLRKVKKAAHEHFDEFRKKICVALPNDYSQQRGIMSFPNTGSKVMIGHFANDKDVDQYLGREFDVVAIEELTQLSPTKIKDILSCLRTTKIGWRPRMYANWNWGGISHAYVKSLFYEPFRNNQETETKFIKSTIHDNKILMDIDPQYIKTLESFTGWKRKSWLDGNPDFQAGQYFTNWNDQVHVIKAIDEKKTIVRWYAGLDYGHTHPLCFLLAGEDRNGNLYILDEHHVAQMKTEEHAQSIFNMLHEHHLSIADLDDIWAGRDCFSAKEDGKTIADGYDEQGIRLAPAEVDRITGFSKILNRLGEPEKGIKPTMFIHERCANLITQIPMAQHDEKRPEDVEKMNADPDTNEGGDDALECLKNIVASNPAGIMRFALPVAISTQPFQRLGFS